MTRYSRILNICYNIIINVVSCDEYAEDITEKLYVMNEVNHTNKPPQQIGANVTVTIVNRTTAVIPNKVLNPFVVQGKGNLPALRKVLRV